MRTFTLPLLASLLAAQAACTDAPLQDAYDPKTLPNTGVSDRPRTSHTYTGVMEHLRQKGYDLDAPDASALSIDWPLTEDPKTAMLDRFGTPIIFAFGSESRMAYFHDSLDIFRSATTLPDALVAPVDGEAFLFNYYGRPQLGSDYENMVVIYHRASKLVVSLMHVKVDPALIAAVEAGGGSTPVRRGQAVGRLAEVPGLPAASADEMRHTHVSVIDGAAKRLLNGIPYLPAYGDRVAPAVHEIYLLNEAAAKIPNLASGQLDVVIDAYDRDDGSERNFEVGSIAYEISDQRGRVLHSVPRCYLDHLTEPHAEPTLLPARDLLDVGNAAGQVGIGGWPMSDIDNRERRFRYAATHLTVGADGRCGVKADAEGYLQVGDEVQELRVRATIWDHRDNLTVAEATFRR